MPITIDSRQARKRWRDMMDAAVMGDAVVISRYRTPQAVLINYEDYLALQDELDDLRDARLARAAYEEWKRDPSTAIDWEEAKAQLIADGVIDE